MNDTEMITHIIYNKDDILHDMHDATYTNVYMIVLWWERYVEPWCPVQILWKWVDTFAETEFAIDPSCHDGPCKDYNQVFWFA